MAAAAAAGGDAGTAPTLVSPAYDPTLTSDLGSHNSTSSNGTVADDSAALAAAAANSTTAGDEPAPVVGGGRKLLKSMTIFGADDRVRVTPTTSFPW
jgi:V8-like Glu-specific endopeptidase